MPSLPKRYNQLSDYEQYFISGDTLSLRIDSRAPSLEAIRLLNRFKGNVIIFLSNYDAKSMRELLYSVSNYITNNNNILLNLMNLNIKKGEYIPFGMLPQNIKIDVCSHCNTPPHDMQTWFSNLSDENFQSVYNKIYQDNQAAALRDERDIARNVYLQLSRKYDFSKMSSTEKMDFMYEWVQNNFEYDMSLVGPDGNYKSDIDRSLGYDPVKVFARGKGTCTGRSRLLKILLNNPYMNVDCYTVAGNIGSLPHEWNEFIDENGQVWEYDLSYRGQKHKKMNGEFARSHKLNENSRSYAVKKCLETPPLPPRRKANLPPPLPPRRKSDSPPPLPPRRSSGSWSLLDDQK